MIEMLILGVLNVLMLAMVGFVSYLHYKERSELVDRLMAKSLPEYKDNRKPEPNDFSDGQENLLDIVEAREEIESL